jgi:hypothetical protein
MRRICLEEAVARPAVTALCTKISIPLMLPGYYIVAGTIFVRAGLRSTMVASDTSIVLHVPARPVARGKRACTEWARDYQPMKDGRKRCVPHAGCAT